MENQQEFIHNLKSLLVNPDLETVKLGLEILKGQPEFIQEKSIQVILFAIYKLLDSHGMFVYHHKEWKEVRLEIGVLLKEQLANNELLKKLLSFKISFGSQNVAKIQANLNKLSKFAGIEIAKSVALVLLGIYQSRLVIKFLSFHSTEEEQIELLERYCIKDNKLDLGHLELNNKYLPSCIHKLDYLEEINLSTNDITQLPDNWKSLKNLKVLDLYNNKIAYIKPQLAKELSALRKLIIIGFDLKSIDFLAHFSALETLNFHQDKHLHYYHSYKIPLQKVFAVLAQQKTIKKLVFRNQIFQNEYIYDEMLEYPHFSWIESENGEPLDFSNLVAIAELAYKQHKEETILKYLNAKKPIT